MPDLTDRAEEALLGSLINDASQAADLLTQIDAGAFTDPARRSVWAAIRQLSDLAAGTTGPEFADLILATTDDPAITSDYLTRLALSPPTADAAHVYARLVAEAALTRAITSNESEIVPVGYSQSLAVARSAFGDDMPAGPGPTGDRALSEEQFLAGIIGHQELTDWIRLDPHIFSSPGLRSVYQAALAIDRLGEPVDALTLAWRTAGIIAQDDYSAGRTTTAETVADAVPPGTITRLMGARVEPLTALEAGRDLLADHARSQIAGQLAARRDTTSYERAAVSRSHAVINHELPLLRPPLAPELEPGHQLSQEGR